MMSAKGSPIEIHSHLFLCFEQLGQSEAQAIAERRWKEVECGRGLMNQCPSKKEFNKQFEFFLVNEFACDSRKVMFCRVALLRRRSARGCWQAQGFIGGKLE